MMRPRARACLRRPVLRGAVAVVHEHRERRGRPHIGIHAEHGRGELQAHRTREYPFVWENGVLNGYARLAMGCANVRAGTRVLMLVLVQA